MYKPCVRRATTALAKDGASALGTRHCPTSRRKANAAPAQQRIVVRHDRERQRSYECRARRGGCGCYDASAAPRKFADRYGSNSGIGRCVVDFCHPRGPIAVVVAASPRPRLDDVLGRSGLLTRVHAFDCEWLHVLFSVLRFSISPWENDFIQSPSRSSRSSSPSPVAAPVLVAAASPSAGGGGAGPPTSSSSSRAPRAAASAAAQGLHR